MSLPGIKPPSGTPVFLAEGHAVKLVPMFADIAQTTGHQRKRRLFTETDRVVSVSLSLNALQMQRLDDWFENTLIAGSLPFAAQVQNQGPGLLWWKARWKAPYTADPRGRGIWRVTGELILTGAGEVDAPQSSALEVSFGVNLTGSATIGNAADLAVTFGVDLRQAVALSVSFGIRLLQGGTRISPATGSIRVSVLTPTLTNATAASIDLDAAFGSVVGSLLRRGTSAWQVILPGSPGDVLTMGATLPGWEAATGGSGGGFTYSSGPPGGSPDPAPAVGDRWVDSDTGIEYTYVFDGTSSQWVEF